MAGGVVFLSALHEGIAGFVWHIGELRVVIFFLCCKNSINPYTEFLKINLDLFLIAVFMLK